MKQLEPSHLRSVLGPLVDTAAGLPADELDSLLWSITHHGQRCVRPRPGVTSEALPFETVPVPWSSLGRFVVDHQTRPGGLLPFAAGDYAVQDAASLLPLTLMQLRPGESVLDCCAAPGGKSAAILESLAGNGLLVSNEVIASRVDTLQLTLARTGASNYAITHQPVSELANVLPEAFDCVLVDAPCTGQSLVGRGKQSLSAFSPTQVEHSAARQQSILRSAITMVKPGGRLIYSTCTFAYAENEAIVGWLRALAPDWQPIELPELNKWQVAGHPGCYRIWPHRDHCAGGFAAGLQYVKQQSSDAWHPASHEDGLHGRSRNTRLKSVSWTPLDDHDCLSEWGQLLAGTLYSKGNSLCWFDSQVSEALRAIAWSGAQVACRFGDHWQPAYPLATLSSAAGSRWFQPHTVCELTDQAAIVYLSGSSVHRASEPAQHGTAEQVAQEHAAQRHANQRHATQWQVAHWQGRPLGWVKQVAEQLKNHLPKPLRQPTLKVS